MSNQNMILVLDAILALQEVQARYSAMMQKAMTEGRDISIEELSELRLENKNKLKALHDAG